MEIITGAPSLRASWFCPRGRALPLEGPGDTQPQHDALVVALDLIQVSYKNLWMPGTRTAIAATGCLSTWRTDSASTQQPGQWLGDQATAIKLDQLVARRSLTGPP